MLKVIVAGSRDFNNYKLLKEKLDFFLQNHESIEIVSGTARGADKLGEKYAREKGFNIKQFPANWDKHGKKAGYLRNEEMANYATHAIIFWDGKSRGTSHMIKLCKRHKLSYRVLQF